MRGAGAPLGGLLPLENGVFKRGQTPLFFLPPLKQEITREWKIYLFERGTKGVSTENKP
jgi:hypothetical protein